MVSARRIVIVAKNDDKRIVRYNHLPQKRRLLEVVEKWKITRTKLNKNLRIQINEYSNESRFVYNKFFLKCPVYFVKIEISTNILSLTGAGKILPARKPHPHPLPHSAPRTAPYPHPHSGVWFMYLLEDIPKKTILVDPPSRFDRGL